MRRERTHLRVVSLRSQTSRFVLSSAFVRHLLLISVFQNKSTMKFWGFFFKLMMNMMLLSAHADCCVTCYGSAKREASAGFVSRSSRQPERTLSSGSKSVTPRPRNKPGKDKQAGCWCARKKPRAAVLSVKC